MTGNKMIDTIILALTLFVSIACAGVFIFTEKIYKRPMPKDDVEKAKMLEETAASVTPHMSKFNKLTINLQSRTSRLRFLDLEPTFVVYHKNDIEALEENKPIVTDTMIRNANEIPPNELNTISGKILFETRVKKQVNEYFKRPVIKDIHFTRFVVQ